VGNEVLLIKTWCAVVL